MSGDWTKFSIVEHEEQIGMSSDQHTSGKWGKRQGSEASRCLPMERRTEAKNLCWHTNWRLVDLGGETWFLMSAAFNRVQKDIG